MLVLWLSTVQCNVIMSCDHFVFYVTLIASFHGITLFTLLDNFVVHSRDVERE